MLFLFVILVGFALICFASAVTSWLDERRYNVPEYETAGGAAVFGVILSAFAAWVGQGIF